MKNALPILLWFLLSCILVHAQKPELVVPVGHTNTVTSVAFSPNGRYALSGSDDNTMRLWEITSGQEVRRFEGHTNGVHSVAFSPDGRYALSGGGFSDKTLRLWEVATGREVRRFLGHTNVVHSVAFSPDGRHGLSGSADNTLRLWDVATGQEIRRFQGHTYFVFSVAFSPDGRYALSGSYDRSLRLWDITNGQEVRRFLGHTHLIYSVAFSPDGRYALSGSFDKTIRLWEIATGHEVRSFQGHTSSLGSVVFSADGRYVLSGSTDNTLRLWETASGQEVRRFEGHKESVSPVAFSPDGRYALSGSSDKSLRLWEVASGQEVRRFEGHTDKVNSVAFSPNGRFALSGAGLLDKTIRLWGLASAQETRSLRGHSNSVESATFSPDGRYILSGSADLDLRLWEIATSQGIRRFEGHRNSVSSVAFSPDGRYALSGSHDKTLRLWEIANGQEIRRFEGHTNDVLSVAFSPDGRWALSGSRDKSMRLWEVATGQEVRRFQGPDAEGLPDYKDWVHSVAFSPDGRYVVLASLNRSLVLWELSTGREVRRFEGHTQLPESVVFSPDGHYLLSGGYDNTIRLWDVVTGREIRRFQSHINVITSVAFSPDAHFVLSGSWDNTTKIWNTQTGQEIATLIAVDSTDWVVTTPRGLFDASEGALTKMHYVVNDSTDQQEPWKVIELNQIRHRYFQPSLLPILLGKSDELPRPVPYLETIPLPPTMRLAIKKDELTVVLTNRKGGIGPVSFRFNGAELTIKIDLTKYAHWFGASNTITILPYNAEGWVSGKAERILFKPTRPLETYRQQPFKGVVANEVTVARAGKDHDFKTPKGPIDVKSRKPENNTSTVTRFRAVVVGTSTAGLRFSHKDAEKVALSLSLVAGKMLGADKTTVQLLTASKEDNLLANKKQLATRGHILDALKDAQNTRAEDHIFVLYLSGHGINYSPPGTDGDLYFLTAGAQSTDAAYIQDITNRNQFMISFRELAQYLNLIPATKKFVILDLCGAGTGLNRFMSEAKAVLRSDISVLNELRDKTAIYIMASSTAGQLSYESNKYQQSLATYALLKGMRGAGKTLVRKGGHDYISVANLLLYIEREVPKLAVNIGGIQKAYFAKGSLPKSNIQTDFELGIMTDDISRQIPLAEPKPVVLVGSIQDDQSYLDVLKLRKQLEAKLDEQSNQPESPFYLIQAEDYPDAYVLAGRYWREGNRTRFEGVLSGGQTKSPISIPFTEAIFLIDTLVNRVTEIIKKTSKEVSKP